jgi:hypothetical protein
MNLSSWTRRRFLQLAATGSLSRLRISDYLPHFQATPLPPEVTSGKIQPLSSGNTSRPIRYTPDSGGFAIHNGKEYFNRPLYSSTAFRVDAGDLPEFSLYLPGHGGNLKLGLISANSSKWLSQAESIVARYVNGRMSYEIHDKLLGTGSLQVEVQTGFDSSSFLVCVRPSGIPYGLMLAWAFGGASGKKGKRGGDIGCESLPVSQLFQVQREDCAKNQFALSTGTEAKLATLQSPAGNFHLFFPDDATLAVRAYDHWLSPPQRIATTNSEAVAFPILTGSAPLQHHPLYLEIRQETVASASNDGPTEQSFANAKALFNAASSRLVVTSPDAYIDTAVAALCSAEIGIWDNKQGCVMHGAVAWRSPLAGWRGPYALDILGEHDQAQTHFRRWLARQNIEPVVGSNPATGPFDPGKRMSRKENLLHSNGDLSHNHYDMNLVFFDVLLRHLRWTGDLQFAKEAWATFERHLAWERRLFRREFQVGGETLPLYEAYAAIWASDNLQYSGGGVAHSSAYNAFSFHRAAELAKALGKEPAPFLDEANRIDKAVQKLLWVEHKGELAEAKDLMEPQTVYDNAALWTLYHAVDSEVLSKQQAWQMTVNRLHTYRKVPITGEGVPAGDWYILSCSNWLPYMWSLNLLLMAENSHLALAMWQIGMKEEAFRILKGNLLDSMFQGLCPGNFHMTSQLDVHRQEAQRDFGDPMGITSRAILEGLFGIRPNLIRNEVVWMPGFPASWDRATMTQRNFSLRWHRKEQTEQYSLTCSFKKRVTVRFIIPARTTSLPEVTANGVKIPCTFDGGAVGLPWVCFSVAQDLAPHVEVKWHGHAPTEAPEHRVYAQGSLLKLPAGVSLQQIDDPQQCLQNGYVQTTGVHTVFARMQSAEASWNMPIAFTVELAKPKLALCIPAAASKFDTVNVSKLLTSPLTTIFTRSYASPRSPYCSLAIPDSLLGGWADIGEPIIIDDSGLRNNSTLLVADRIPFQMQKEDRPNCVFLSRFEPDHATQKIPMSGFARRIFILVTGTTVPQCSRMVHATMTVRYKDGSSERLEMRNPETWWPIEQDYLLDDYLFCSDGALPLRVDLSTGRTRLLEPASFKGKGRLVKGGAATVLHLELDPAKELNFVEFEVELYGIVAALLGITLERA